MKYFELYQLPVSFKIDEKILKQKFLELSKKYHPDFFTHESVEKQAEILLLSTLNNKAFKTLSNPESRIKYILTEKGFLQEEEHYQLPQDFLFEMLDLNEMAESAATDKNTFNEAESEIVRYKAALDADIQEDFEGFDEQVSDREFYEKVKEYYFKTKYLLRIRQQLDKFAGA